MMTEVVKIGLVVGGFDRPTVLPRAAIGDRLHLSFSGTSDWPSRISVHMKDDQFSGHINIILAEEMYALRDRIKDMWGIAQEVSTRKNPGWAVEVHYKLSQE